MQEALSRALGRALPVGSVEQALLELRLLGMVVKESNRFAWAIPLLRSSLRSAEPERAASQLAEEMAGQV